MAANQTQAEVGLSEAPMLADHLALDMLNTQALSDGNRVDFWNSDEDVLAWLKRFTANPLSNAIATGLLVQGRALRTLARQLIIQRKEGSDIEIGELNEYLHNYTCFPQLKHDNEGRLLLTHTASGETTKALLGPVAEAVAQLLVEGNFELVKQCEHPDCILWFYDRTKAHKRRWCSMALCGNRYKAAQFRKRSSGDAIPVSGGK